MSGDKLVCPSCSVDMSWKIVRKEEFEGQWWAERDAGLWTPWDNVASDWGQPKPPPQGLLDRIAEEEQALADALAAEEDAARRAEEEAARAAAAQEEDDAAEDEDAEADSSDEDEADENKPFTSVEQAQLARHLSDVFAASSGGATSAGGAPPGELAGPIERAADRWTQTFPPLSIQRLVFFLVAVALAVGAMAASRSWQGHPVSTSLTAGSIIALWLFLVATWLLARPRISEDGTSVPMPSAKKKQPAGPPISLDFVQCLPIAVLGMIVASAIDLGRNHLDARALLISIAAGTLLAVVVTVRRTIWTLAIAACLAGFLIAVGFVAVSHLVLSRPRSLVLAWLVCTAVLCVVGAPVWLSSLRRTGRSPKRLPAVRRTVPIWATPSWALTVLAVIPFACVWVLLGLQDGGKPVPVPDPSLPTVVIPTTPIVAPTTEPPPSPTEPPSPPPVTGASTEEDVSTQLITAWKTGDRNAAERLAARTTVDGLFVTLPPSDLLFKGCEEGDDGVVRCTADSAEGQLLLVPGLLEDGSFQITATTWTPAAALTPPPV